MGAPGIVFGTGSLAKLLILRLSFSFSVWGQLLKRLETVWEEAYESHETSTCFSVHNFPCETFSFSLSVLFVLMVVPALLHLPPTLSGRETKATTTLASRLDMLGIG